MKSLLCLTLSLAGVIFGTAQPATKPAGANRPPNVVLILTDDQGYGDVGCFGARDVATPNIDRLAREGMRFTSFYVAQAVCTASRAALLTGCYANRVGLFGALNHTSVTGIHEDETLLSELCKQQGYATAVFGKWHLGTLPKFNPTRHGFDEYLGIPYSNDNSKFHPSVRNMPPLPLYEGERVVETDFDQAQFTRRFTERAVAFIRKNRERPFFLYVPHVMPHVPIFASPQFRRQSQRGLYGDVIEELDWSVGEIVRALNETGVANNTLVIFASDNGPFLSYGAHAGSAKPLREGKLTTFEGGVRVPCVMRWPGRIPSGAVCDEPVGTLDVLPTIAELIGARLPEKKLDGQSIRGPMLGERGARSPHEALFFYAEGELQAVRSGAWKLHFAHRYLTVDGEPGRDGKPANWGKLQPNSITLSGLEGIASRHGYRIARIEKSLFNLKEDIAESRNVAAEHPDIVERLEKLAEPVREALGDGLTGRSGKEVRPAGKG